MNWNYHTAGLIQFSCSVAGNNVLEGTFLDQSQEADLAVDIDTMCSLNSNHVEKKCDTARDRVRESIRRFPFSNPKELPAASGLRLLF